MEPIFTSTNITKRYGQTIALNNVDIAIHPGEIRGFIGENGSGKSTMGALMTGIHDVTSGSMYFHGKPWAPASMVDALEHGIGIIVQENGTIPQISVAENIFLGELWGFCGANFFEERRVENFSPDFDRAILEKFDTDAAAGKTGLRALYEECAALLRERNRKLLERYVDEYNSASRASFETYRKKLRALEERYAGILAVPGDHKYDLRRKHEDSRELKRRYAGEIRALDARHEQRCALLQEDGRSLLNHYKNFLRDKAVPGADSGARKLQRCLRRAVLGPFVNRKKLNKYAQLALSRIGVTHIRAEAPCGAYDIQDRKLIEIAKCLNKDPEILIVDETTTALSETGRAILYRLMEDLKSKGRSVLFVSHDLDEIMEKCDTLTVLRDGNIITNLTRAKGEFDPDAIRRAMIGRELRGDYYRSDYDGSYGDEVVLRMVDGIEGTALRHVDLELHRGEILGIGGLSECGMHTLGKALFGNIRMEGGYVYCGPELGTLVTNEVTAMNSGIGYLPKNRDTEGLAQNDSIFSNIAIASINNIAKLRTFIFRSSERRIVNRQVRDLSIKCNSPSDLISSLSGGNKQKVSLGKWIGNDSRILILDCPTRGVDIGVKQFIYRLMCRMKAEGRSIIMISEELPELIGMSDRILIMKDGAVTKEFARSPGLTQEQIVQYMI